MNSRERVLATLQHSEPDQVPFDLGGAPNTGIHINAYRNLLKHWREDREVEIEDIIFQKALIDEDILQRLKVDFRGLDFSVFASAKLLSELREDEKYFFFIDDWGIKWVKPKIKGLYYDIRQRPLSGRINSTEVDTLNTHPNCLVAKKLMCLKEKQKSIGKEGWWWYWRDLMEVYLNMLLELEGMRIS